MLLDSPLWNRTCRFGAQMNRPLSALITLLISIVFIAGCDKKAAREKPVPEVFVISATEKPYKPSRGFNGRIESRSDVAIQAQVSGKLLKIHFREGDQVKAGDPLFQIDPSPYKAVLSKAEAELAKAEANRVNAARNFERGSKLVKDGYISASDYDSLETKSREAIAQVEGAKAALESARVDLDYTLIRAPQDGRVGRSVPAVGDVVSPQSGTLTSLVGQDDMDVVFQLPERVILQVKQSGGKIRQEDIIVAVQLQDGSEYPHTGGLDYFSNRVDPGTGTVETRARIPNPDDFLRPGMFVQAILRLKEPLMGLMVPQAAVQVDQRGPYVLAIDPESKVTRKNLVTGERFGENVLIQSGLEVGDRIVMRGVQKARPGDPVIVKDYAPGTEASEGSTRDQ